MEKPKKETLNQLRWNFVVNEPDQIVNYFFMIVNSDKREIQTIKNRIFSVCENIDDLTYAEREGNVAGLQYLLMKAPLFNKKLGFLQMEQVYRGKRKKDPRLYDREVGIDGLERYVRLEVEKISSDSK
jgi:hypothetical protein